MKKLKGDRVLGMATLLIGLIFAIGSFSIRNVASISDALGARFWPQLLSIIVIVLSIVQIVQSHLNIRALRLKESENEEEFAFFEDKRKAIFVLSAVVLYAILISYVGFPITTMVVSGILMIILGMKKGAKLLVSMVALTAALVMIFPILLGIPLPRGIGIFESITRLIY